MALFSFLKVSFQFGFTYCEAPLLGPFSFKMYTEVALLQLCCKDFACYAVEYEALEGRHCIFYLCVILPSMRSIS